MYQRLSFYKIAFLNMLLVSFLFITGKPAFLILIKTFVCLINLSFLAIVLHSLPGFIKKNAGRLLIGRKRTLLALLTGVYILLTALSIYYKFQPKELFLAFLAWTLMLSIALLFADQISYFLHKIFRKPRRIAIVGYDDHTNKLVEVLKRKSHNQFVGHLYLNNPFDNLEDATSLSDYIDFAKKNQVTELYISVAEKKHSAINILAEEAEKHFIRVNFIAPEEELEKGFYHVSYIGGLPVLQRYREPLKRLHKQFIKRGSDIFISSLIIVFILSWLVPLIGILIKLESRGPVFFRQLRSGRNNNSFWCYKFRSMRTNNLADVKQATKDDTRITRIGSFLRKTSLDEFPQFINVFFGDMSIVGPRPHMLRHTEEYSEQVKNYMARLYLKPGVTGWAQVNGYRGEISNVELLKTRVEHDIWYMENWSLMLDIKIMYLTFANIIKGEENAY